jgi:hypothetical protein
LYSVYWRGAISILVFLVLWEIGSLSKIWIKWEAFEWLRSLLVAFGFKAALPALDRRCAGADRGPCSLGPRARRRRLLAKLVHELPSA